MIKFRVNYSNIQFKSNITSTEISAITLVQQQNSAELLICGEGQHLSVNLHKP